MSVFRLSVLVALAVGVLVVVAALFILRVEIDFTVSVAGRVEPNRVLRVAVPAQGRVAFIAPLGRVRKGALLLALDTGAEEDAVAGLSRERGILQEEAGLEQKRLAAETAQQASEQAQVEKEALLLQEQLTFEQGKLRELSQRIQACLGEQKRAMTVLRLDEERMLTSLASKGVVTKLDMAVAKQRSALSRSEELQIRLEAERDKILRRLKIEELGTRLAIQTIRLSALRQRPVDTRRVLEVRARIEELGGRITQLGRGIKQKCFHAPFDGEVMTVGAHVGEVLQPAAAALLLADDAPAVFRATAAPAVRRFLRKGQEARIRLQSYPYFAFGRLPARLQAIVTRLPADAAAGYGVLFTVGEAPYELMHGLQGTADVITFRGTVVKYLMHRYAREHGT